MIQYPHDTPKGLRRLTLPVVKACGRALRWRGWPIVLTVLGVLVALMLAAGCQSWDWGSGGGTVTDGGTTDPKGGGTFGATATALWWMGLIATAAGIACVGARIAGLSIMPAGTGLSAILAGIPTMLAADVLAAHQWIAWVILAALVVIGVVELLGRKKIKTWMTSFAETVTEPSQ